ncbi:MAG: ATP-binding protein [Thermodesulfovibrio sp.]|nr:ATP-binding protein [Thermodesulfovibrio sp.]
MEQAIVNIVVNARDAMPQGGILTIETKNVYVEDDYVKSHFDFKKGPYIMLAISDTGVGIPEEIKDKIFEPFFTTKPESGTGLGLSTVYGIVKQHGGNIHVYSELNKGTTFKIYLPQVEKPIEQVRFDATEEKLFKGSETILVIDDDDSVRAVLLEMLKKLGYKTLEAKDYNTALFLAQFYDKNIDLIISDVVLPTMSGPKLVNRIKKFRPDIKVLYMSGYTDNVISKHGVINRKVNFIQKPFSISELSRKIREILNKQ